MIIDVLYIVAVVLLAALVFMAGIPSFPAVAAMFVMAVIFGFANGFQDLTAGNLAILFVITALAIAVDWSSGLLGAKYGGAHKKSLAYGFMGTLLGTLFLPPFGGFLGLFIGVAMGELKQHGDAVRATKAAVGSLLGTIAGQIVVVLLALTFLVSFAVMAWR